MTDQLQLQHRGRLFPSARLSDTAVRIMPSLTSNSGRNTGTGKNALEKSKEIVTSTLQYSSPAQRIT